MRTKLGTYYVPADETLAGTIRGDAWNGLQEDFWEAIKAWCSEQSDNPLSRVIVSSEGEDSMYPGYLSQIEIEKRLRKGHPLYNDNKVLFGWGLAQEFVYSTDSTQKALEQSAVDALGNHGLSSVESAAGNFICPASWQTFTTSASVVYGGDVYVNDDLTEEGDGNALFYADQQATFANTATAELLTGERAFYNDENVWQTVSSLLKASMRATQSGPDGSILSFYPDRWGKAGSETATVNIPLIEVQSLSGKYDNEEYYSHVYCNPVDITGSTMSVQYSIGAVGIESDNTATVRQATENELNLGVGGLSNQPSELLKGFVNIPKGHEYEYSPAYLYGRYGVRVDKCGNSSSYKVIQASYETREENPQYILPFLLALYTFMTHWSKFKTITLTISYNPFIWPGCRITIDELGLSAFVESVNHSMSYSEAGFTTTVTLTAMQGTLVDGMVNA